MLTFVFLGAGSRAFTSTLSADARQSSSKSATQRIWDSIFASVSRLRSQPSRPQRAARSACDSPASLRSCLILGPAMLRGLKLARSDFRTHPLAFIREQKVPYSEHTISDACLVSQGGLHINDSHMPVR